MFCSKPLALYTWTMRSISISRFFDQQNTQGLLNQLLNKACLASSFRQTTLEGMFPTCVQYIFFDVYMFEERVFMSVCICVHIHNVYILYIYIHYVYIYVYIIYIYVYIIYMTHMGQNPPTPRVPMVISPPTQRNNTEQWIGRQGRLVICQPVNPPKTRAPGVSLPTKISRVINEGG